LSLFQQISILLSQLYPISDDKTWEAYKAELIEENENAEKHFNI